MHNEKTDNREKRTLFVIIFTLAAMVLEIIYGYMTHSMALLADGYHMSTHALALFLTYIAYILIRKFQNSPKFKNGTEKIGSLTAYTSALFLGLTGIWIIFEAFNRLISPLAINFNDAIIVAFIGLVVNGVCILIMEGKHTHSHHTHIHEHACDKDYNFKAAYFHILADAMTSLFAIVALFAGKYFGIFSLDSLIGILGGIIILKWAYGLLKNTVKKLIDMS